MVEVFASVETGTGTIAVALPNGTTFRVASGEALAVLAKTPGPGGPTSQVSASKISFAPVAVKRTYVTMKNRRSGITLCAHTPSQAPNSAAGAR